MPSPGEAGRKRPALFEPTKVGEFAGRSGASRGDARSEFAPCGCLGNCRPVRFVKTGFLPEDISKYGKKKKRAGS